MDPAGLIGVVTVAVAIALALHVGLRSEKTGLRLILLALLASIAIAVTVVLVQRNVDPQWETALWCVALVAVVPRPALWAYLAARHARASWLTGRGAVLLLVLPLVLIELCLLTNGLHHGVFREHPDFSSAPSTWAGPIFWAFVAWGYLCGIAAAALYLRAAHRLWAKNECPRAYLTAVAGVLPLLGGLVHLADLAPYEYPVLAASLMISLLILISTIMRYPLLEDVPLAHRDVVDCLRDGVIIANRSDLIVDLNPPAARFLRLQDTMAPTRTLTDTISGLLGAPEDDELRRRLHRLIESCEPLRTELRTSDERVFDVRADCVLDDEGEPIGQYAVLRDRTEENRYGEIVRRTQKLETVGTMAAGIAHEINNPLAFIRANLGHLQRMGAVVEEARVNSGCALADELEDLREIADDALEGIDRIERIASDMRRLSSAPREGFAPTDVNDVAREAARLIGLRRGTPVEISTSLEEDLPAVLGVSQLLVQAVLNLLVNAHQVLQGIESARISLETERSGDDVLIRIRDNGPGIPSDVGARVFDPFFTTKKADDGTGLGLSIVRDIFGDHGGTVDFDSPPGGGTVFTARIPARPV